MTIALLPAAPTQADSATTFPIIANLFFSLISNMTGQVNALVSGFDDPPPLLTPLSFPPANGSSSFVTGAGSYLTALADLPDEVNAIIADLGLDCDDITTLPARPTRTSTVNYEATSVAYVAALTVLRDELNAFIAALNAYDPLAFPSTSTIWRMGFPGTQTPSSTTNLYDVEYRSTVGGSNVATGGTATASSAASGQDASKAFDGSTAGFNFWASNSSQSPISPTWLQYAKGSPYALAEIVLRGYSLAGNCPTDLDLSAWTGSSFVAGPSFDLGPWANDIQVKYVRIAAGEVWSEDWLTLTAGSADYSGAKATAGIHVTPTANTAVEALTVVSRVQTGESYQPVVYQVNSSTGAFIAELAAGPVIGPAASTAVASRIWYLGTSVPLTAGTRYVLALRRTDGTNTSNAGLWYHAAGANTFRTAPITINGTYTIANKATPSVGAAANDFATGGDNYSVGAIYLEP